MAAAHGTELAGPGCRVQDHVSFNDMLCGISMNYELMILGFLIDYYQLAFLFLIGILNAEIMNSTCNIG